ncbi:MULTISPECIES: DUF2809 domain-containing protein [unclassified Empedobacter]|uniref:ribosomal maturation YjgA family protein n=1 Tax=unclassified Empedobacter TaxID=2643773 RepID=UPI0025C2C24C|nr:MULTISPECIES: DUF2809 domain-containing protein [unclassified Empedobacter]
MFRFHIKSFIIALIIFILEVLIALYVHDAIIRPYVGDILVVILIYYFIKAFVQIKPLYIAIFTLLIAFTVETLQYFKFIELIGLKDSTLAKMIIGTSFSWIDMLCYIIGFGCLFIMDKELRKNA